MLGIKTTQKENFIVENLHRKECDIKKVRDKLIIIFLLIGFLFVQLCIAEQESERANLLKQNIKSSKALEDTELQLGELLDIYAKDNRFNEFYSFLKTLEKDKKFKATPLIYYYKTLTRFSQMQFLEENKMWEELFDNKDLYVSDTEVDLEKAKKLSTSTDALSLKLKFLEWQLKKDNEEVSINTLEDLFNLTQEYAQIHSDIQVIKDIADALSKEKQINYAKKLYSVFVSKISETGINQEELRKLTESFLEDDKIDLAISLYDVYLDRIINTQPDKSIAIQKMFDVAEKFAHSGWQEGLDPFYAEKVFKRIEFLYSIKAFSALSQYRRAYNLERSKEYESCLAEYLKLIDNFPKYQDKDRIYFRLGIFNVYVFNEIDQTKEYFLKVVSDYPKSLDYLNSLYHLGLLSHWQDNLEKASEFYKTILDKAKDIKTDSEIVTLTELRIKEIEEEKDIEYNLRMFLEAKLKEREEKKYIQLELFAKPAKNYLDEPVKFQTNSYFIDTGCLQQDFTYLWSGQLGSNQNPFNEYEFETSYQDLGTKVVNVVLVGPSGVVDGTIEMADIYKEAEE